MAASCEQGNGSTDFIEGRKYIFFLSDYQLLIGTRVHEVSYTPVTKTGCITLVPFTFRTLQLREIRSFAIVAHAVCAPEMRYDMAT